MIKARISPKRLCIGCNQMKDKGSLVRILKNNKGEITLDPTGKAGGRGAYMCRDSVCFATMRKTRRLERAFGRQIPDEVYESLEKTLQTTYS